MKKLIAFFEIPATDFRRAVDFYETVLGVQLPTFECETEKMACFTEEGETVGAIFHAPDYLPSEKGVLQISTFFLQRMAYLSISTVRILNKRWKKCF